jgi:hypothetical protein
VAAVRAASVEHVTDTLFVLFSAPALGAFEAALSG